MVFALHWTHYSRHDVLQWLHELIREFEMAGRVCPSPRFSPDEINSLFSQDADLNWLVTFVLGMDFSILDVILELWDLKHPRKVFKTLGEFVDYISETGKVVTVPDEVGDVATGDASALSLLSSLVEYCTTGTHRVDTPEELIQSIDPSVVERVFYIIERSLPFSQYTIMHVERGHQHSYFMTIIRLVPVVSWCVGGFLVFSSSTLVPWAVAIVLIGCLHLIFLCRHEQGMVWHRARRVTLQGIQTFGDWAGSIKRRKNEGKKQRGHL